ncbi:flavin reductase family protein [Phyllobacterium sp. SB3]|uniref:flavin reductase family protein n=1 Tax=Phyllobacterium sp. SB3 TaxID=3156073 RepID=UPI0032AEC8C0
MRLFPAAVSIVSCKDGDAVAGATVTAVSSLAMDPPSLLVCVNRSSSFYAHASRATDFCINVLQPCHETIAAEFAGRTPQGSGRFLHGSWTDDGVGPPILTDARLNITCRIAKAVDHGTHVIIIGNVRQVSIQGSTSVLYHDGSYGQFTPLREVDAGSALCDSSTRAQPAHPMRG